MCIKTTLTAASTTLGLLCWNWGAILSQMCSDSLMSAGGYSARVDRMVTRPHSVHSLSAMRSFFRVAGVTTSALVSGAVSLISDRAWTELATTAGFGSPIISCRVSRKPFSMHMDGLRSNSLATQMAAVLRT